MCVCVCPPHALPSPEDKACLQENWRPRASTTRGTSLSRKKKTHQCESASLDNQGHQSVKKKKISYKKTHQCDNRWRGTGLGSTDSAYGYMNECLHVYIHLYMYF